MRVLDRGMPEGIDLLNLNFPAELSEKSKIVITKPTKVRMHNEVERRLDPNGRPYYWYLGIEKEAPKGTDAYEVSVNNNIALSPVKIEFIHDEEIDQLKRFMKD